MNAAMDAVMAMDVVMVDAVVDAMEMGLGQFQVPPTWPNDADVVLAKSDLVVLEPGLVVLEPGLVVLEPGLVVLEPDSDCESGVYMEMMTHLGSMEQVAEELTLPDTETG